MSDHRSPQADRLQLLDLVRWIYLGSRTGQLSVGEGANTRFVFFRHGDLHLTRSHPLARAVAARLDALAPAASAGGRDPELVRLMQRIAHTMATWDGAEVAFEEGAEVLPQGLVGPLPTALLVMEHALDGQSDRELEASLGGPATRLKAVDRQLDRGRYGFLADEDFQLLASLGQPRALESLLDGLGDGAGERLRQLARLEAVGLVERLPEEDVAEPDVVDEVVRRLHGRIRASLDRQPLKMDPAVHRERLADLLARLGDLDHYQLLGLPTDVASSGEIHDAYERLARLVHPAHARRLGLEGREGGLAILFEAVTKAHYTLSDPRRRAAYDREMGIAIKALPAPEVRDEERREIARSCFRQAQVRLGQEDFHGALELLRQAVRADGRHEYYALLGQVQARNPNLNWLRQAAQSLRTAIELGSPDLAVRLHLAEVYEQLDQRGEARRLYASVLERSPRNAHAVDGLTRLDDKAARRGRPWWQRIFGAPPD